MVIDEHEPVAATEIVKALAGDERAAFEADYIRRMLVANNRNVSRTAHFIGMERSALHRKLKALGVDAIFLERPEGTFTLRRGLAGGIASSGVGAGTLLVPVLVAMGISTMPWREAMRLLALGVLVLGLLASGLLRRAPASAQPGAGGTASGLSLRETLRTPTFRWFYLATVLASPVMFIPFAHLSASARDLGLHESLAVGLVGLIGIGSLVGRFSIGWLADRRFLFGEAGEEQKRQCPHGATCCIGLNL